MIGAKNYDPERHGYELGSGSTDPVTEANSKMASMALALAQARAFVKHDAEHPGVMDGFQDYAKGVLARIDQALEGTIHSFTANGARR